MYKQQIYFRDHKSHTEAPDFMIVRINVAGVLSGNNAICITILYHTTESKIKIYILKYANGFPLKQCTNRMQNKIVQYGNDSHCSKHLKSISNRAIMSSLFTMQYCLIYYNITLTVGYLNHLEQKSFPWKYLFFLGHVFCYYSNSIADNEGIVHYRST